MLEEDHLHEHLLFFLALLLQVLPLLYFSSSLMVDHPRK